MQKDFDNWNIVKQSLEQQGNLPGFKEREIWWLSVGINLGHETSGKNEFFERPVLIVRKFNNRLFWAVPLSTKSKNTPHYHAFSFKGRDQYAMLTQLRLYDSNRMIDRMGQLSRGQFNLIKQSLKEYLR